MPAPTIDEAFITKFNRDVHLSYQQRSSLFRPLVRTDADVNAEKVRFQKLGVIDVSAKARNGNVSIANPEHSYVECTMLDRYAGVAIDKLDLTKLNIEIRGGYVDEMSGGFARETDDQIIDAMVAGATQTVGSYATAVTRNIALLGREALDDVNVPSDGRVFCAITPRQWSHLMTITEFANEQFVGEANLPWIQEGMQMKLWNRTYWFVSTRLPGIKTAQAKAYMWHQRCVGHGINSEVAITWDWENLMQAWSGVGSMSMNAVVIDPVGLVELHLNDTAALP